MKKFILRRLGAAVTAVSMCLLFPVQGLAATNLDSGSNSLFLPDAPAVTENLPDDARVHIIVELEKEPVLEQVYSLRSFDDSGEYFKSGKAKSLESSLAAERRSVSRAMSQSDMDIQTEYEYSAVFNGMSVIADAGDLEEIRDLPGVKDAFISERYALPKPVVNDPQLTESVSVIGGDIMHGSGFTGKGTVVAILDTGLDMSHEAFGSVNNPKYSKEDIQDIISSTKLTVGKLSADVLYHGDKIPYAYDYAGGDTNVSGGDSHGTHVAGIVGANSGGVIEGVAPDAQLMILKVFDDAGTGAYDSDILAALDDAVKLGADAINMSLGTPAGFSEASSASMREVYQRVIDAGINLTVSAANSYSSTKDGECGTDLPYVTNPDNSTVGSPSTFAAALSVASSNNVVATLPYFTAGGRDIRFDDAAKDPGHRTFSSITAGSYTYVDCGFGGTADFSGLDLAGKIALIRRGGLENDSVLTFTQKEANAKAAGAMAAIVYDNVEGDLVSMATSHEIPIVSISKADGEWLLSLENKTISCSPDYIKQFSDVYAGRMSDFSSWGVTPDLKIKPEITAPGGNIYSSVPGSRYSSMSGTSMASPHMAGAAAIMAQYINEEQDGLSMSSSARTALANALLMSTAVPVRDENDHPYSPRRQGAGLVNLDRATKAKAYLLGTDGGRPVLNLGESEDGNFDFSFDVKSLGAGNIRYVTSVEAETESVTTIDGKKYIAQVPRMLGNEEISVTQPSSVTLSGSSARVSGSINLTEAGKAALNADFPNGIFVEGFITLTPESGDDIPLSIPFVGFFGDWGQAPAFDVSYYSGDTPNTTSMWLGYFNNSNGGGFKLGSCLYGDTSIKSGDKIAIPGGDKSRHVTAVCALLRCADTLTFSATNAEGETVYRETSKQVRKSYYSSGEGFYTPMAAKGWTAIDEWGDALPDGQYTYTVTASVDGEKQSVSFPVTIDSQKPEVVSSVIENGKWKVKVRDNHYIQAVCATMGSTPLTGWVNPEQSAPGETTEIIFDLANPAFTGLTKAKIGITDYADNQFVSDYISFEGTNTGGGTDPDPDPNPGEENPPVTINFDLNGDGRVNQLDITFCQKFYQARRGDSGWGETSPCDVDGSGRVDISDLIMILRAYLK